MVGSKTKVVLALCVFCSVTAIFALMIKDLVHHKQIIRSHEKASCEIVHVVWTENPLVGNFTISVNNKKDISKTMNCWIPYYAKDEQVNCIFHVNATFWAYFDPSTNDLVFSLPQVSEYIFPIIWFVGILMFLGIAVIMYSKECFKKQRQMERIQI